MLRYANKKLATSLLLLGYLCVSNVVADNLKIPDFYSEPGLNKGRAYENGLGIEAIDPFSGGLLLQYQDMVLPGTGPDIAINRTYRSLQGAEPILEQRQERKVTGIGWDIHFGRVWTSPNTVLCDTLGTVTTGPNLPASNRNPTFEASDGSRKVLVTEFSGTTPYHMISKDRWVATCLPAVDNPWSNIDGLVVQSPDGMTYTLGVRGRTEIGDQAGNLPLLVNSIEDRNGNWLVIDYDYTSLSYALIDRVRASDDREVRFFYTKGALPEDVRLDRITAYPGTPEERTWRYTYTQAQFTSTGFTSPWYLLTKVQSPESEVFWRYTYYPDDPDGPDAATGKYDPGRFSLKTITLPEGAAIDYAYSGVSFDTRPGALGADIVTTVVNRKIQRGDSIENGTWNYDYRPYSIAPGALDALISEISFPTLDETRVRGPQFCTTYKHVGIKSINFNANDNLDDGVWTVGLLLERRQFAGTSCSGTVLEKETIKWGKQLVSEQNEFRPSRSAIDENTYAPIMLVKTTQRDGTDYLTTFSNYDVYGNPQTIVEQGQDSKTTNLVYQPNTTKWLLKLVQEEAIQGIGSITRTFDGNGNTLTENKYGVTTGFAYYTTGNVAAIQDARGLIKRFNNYFRGTPQNEVHPESVTINRVVNEASTVQSETNGRGKITQYTYDNLNRITSITQPRGALITIARPSANETILTRGGFRKREVLDGLGRVVSSISEDTVTGESIQQTTTYDNIGNKVFESYPNSALGTTTSYDALGRVLTQSQPGGVTTRFAYSSGNQVQVTDPRGNITRFSYRAYGSPDQRALMRTESPESVVTTITRNQLDLVTSIQQGGFQRDFAYDSRYYLINETHPEVGVIQYGRDALGNKTSETYAINTTPKVTGFSYDGLNRLSLVNYVGFSPDVVYQYDLNSNLVSLQRSDIRWDYAYDDNDNLTSERLTVGAQQFDVAYQYNSLDALSNITYPSGLTIDYAPNRYGWPTEVSGFVTAVDYHPSGHIQSIQYANGVQQSIQLNNRLLPSSISAAGIVDLNYLYDLAGNVSSIGDGLDPTNDVAMVYDGINRLTTANGSWGVGSFSYDSGGNLTAKTIGGQTQTYSYNVTTNLLDSVTGSLSAQLAYDVFGNVTADGTRNFVYDESSDLTQVVAGNTFRYDGNKRRTVEQTPNATIYTLYSQAGQLMYEYDDANIIRREYIRLGSNLVAIREDICNATSTDTDGDGIPDCFETKIGLDPADPLDAALDPDRDGLTNLEEFQNKTNLFRSDTDGDGIPDGAEVRLGLDPLTDDTLADPDRDGFNNIQEYEGASDPHDAASVPSGSVHWSVSIAGTVSFPAIADDGTIYVLATNSGEATLYAVPSSGTTLWSRVLLGTGNCSVLSGLDPDEQVPGTDGVKIAGQVAIDRTGTIYASCDGRGTFAFDTEGNSLWSYPAGGFLAVTTDRVFVSPVTSLDAEVHALESTQGALLWKYSVATDVGPFGESIVADSDGVVYAVTGCDSLSENEQTGAFTCDADPYSNGQSIDLHAINPDGSLKWVQRDIGNVSGIPAIGIDGSLYLGVNSALGRASITAVNPDGSLQRKTKGDIGSSDPEVNLPTQPVIDKQGNIYTVALPIRLFRPDLSVNDEWSEDSSYGALNFELNTPTLAEQGHIYRTTAEQIRNRVYSVDNQVLYWATSYVDGPNYSNVSIAPDGTLVAVTAGANSTLYSLVNNDNESISRSVWPMAGGNVRQTRSLEPCDNLDSDGDGLSDCYEQRINSDPADPLDATLDFDSDGLSNLQEFVLQTHPYNADTDGDTMPDGYEVPRGLDPRSNTSELDSDGDGAIDIIEFQLGTEPLDPVSVPAPGAQLWSLPVNAPVEGAPVHHIDHSPVFSGLGEVHYLGEIEWSFSSAQITPVTPIITADDRIVIPNRNFPTLNLLTLDGRRLSSNSYATQLAPGFALDSTGAVYFGSSPNRFFKTVSLGVQWSTVLTSDVTTAPAVNANDLVIVGATEVRPPALPTDPPTTVGIVHAFDTTGFEVWSFETLGEIHSSPAIGADGTLYIGSADGRLYALDSDTGSLVWSFTVGAPVSTAPVIGADGTVYVTVEGGFVYAINPIGTMQWSYQTGGAIRSNPMIGKDNGLYFGSDDGYVYALNPDGTLNWRVAVGAPLGAASPYIDDKGVMYVGTSDNRLLGLYAGVRGLAASPWPTLGHDRHRTGNVTTQLDEVDQPPTLTVVSPAAAQVFTAGDAVVFTATADDPEDGDLANAVSWDSSLDGPLGTGSPLSVSTLSVGQHVVTATVSDSVGNSVTTTVTIDVQQAAVMVTLNTSLDSPQTEGAAVTVSAVVSDTTLSYDYRFRVKGDATGDAWVVLSDYSAQTSVVWDTSTYRGRNRLQVSVREAGTTGSPINSGKTFWVNGVDAATAVVLSTDLSSPQAVGQSVTLNATASGGPGPYEYRFEVRSVTQDGDWQLLQDYSSQASASWATTGYLGKNRLRVFARQSGSPDKPVKIGQAFWVNTVDAATAADLTVTPGGSQPSGTAIQLNAQGVGGSGSYDYEFQLKGPSTADQWQVLQPMSTVSTYNWDTTGILGQHRVRVRLKNAGTDDKPVTRGRNVTLQ